MITGIYAGVLALLVVALVFRVVYLRRTLKVGLGDGGERELTKAVRAHGNSVETIPLALILLFLCEHIGYDAWLLHALGATLLVGRGLHAFGLSRHSGTSFGRFFGMLLTLVAVIIMAVLLLVGALG